MMKEFYYQDKVINVNSIDHWSVGRIRKVYSLFEYDELRFYLKDRAREI